MTTHAHIESAPQLDSDVCRRLLLGVEPWRTLQYGEPDVQAIVRAATTANLLLARSDERVVGFALSAPGVLLGEYLRILVVEPAAQGHGIGRRLMEELERRAFRSWPNVYLCVSDFNLGARGFYRRLGYDEIGVLQNLLLPGKGEVLMRKSIGSWRRFQPA